MPYVLDKRHDSFLITLEILFSITRISQNLVETSDISQSLLISFRIIKDLDSL